MRGGVYMVSNHEITLDDLQDIWQQPGPDYYQRGVKENILQKIWHYGKLRAILSLINKSDVNPSAILDVGCASGWFLSQMAVKYPKASCTGIDVYKDGVEYGKKKYKKLNLTVSDAHKMPFEKDSFDTVVCAEVLEHVVNPREVLKEIRRVLKKEGVAVIEMDTGNLLFKLVWHWWTNLRHGVWENAHIQEFNTEILKNMIEGEGFNIVEQKFFNYTMAVAFLVQKT